jgi:hypothetical protein
MGNVCHGFQESTSSLVHSTDLDLYRLHLRKALQNPIHFLLHILPSPTPIHSSSGFVTIFAEVTQFYRVKGEAWIIEEEHQEQEQEQRRQYQEEASCQV